MQVPENRVSQIVVGKRKITADTALRLSQCFGTSAELWTNLQCAYEPDLARSKAGDEIRRIPALPVSGATAQTKQP